MATENANGVNDKLEDGEKEQMEEFVRSLLKTMPLSSLTQRIVREKYRSLYRKEKPLTAKVIISSKNNSYCGQYTMPSI